MKKLFLLFLSGILYSQIYNWDELYLSIGDIRKEKYEKVIATVSKIDCKTCNCKKIIEELKIAVLKSEEEKDKIKKDYYKLILCLIKNEIDNSLKKREKFKVVSVYPAFLTILRYLGIEEKNKKTYYRIINLLREIQKYQKLNKFKMRDSVLYILRKSTDSIISSY